VNRYLQLAEHLLKNTVEAHMWTRCRSGGIRINNGYSAK
jgi:hypothetical protein